MSSRPTQRAITCKYLTYKFRGKQGSRYIHLPLVHVYLKSDERELTTGALVDSGSTATFIPNGFVELLRLSEHRDASAVGAGGSLETWIGKLKLLKVIKGKNPFHVFRDVTVHIPKAAGAIPYMVLGRDTIFQYFDITFHEKRKKFTFVRV